MHCPCIDPGPSPLQLLPSLARPGDGNLTKQIDLDGNVSSYSYDALGDQTQSVAGYGSSNPSTTKDFYDGDGNLTLSVNAVGDTTSYLYDPAGHQTLEIDGLNTSSAAYIGYAYDADGHVIEESDPDRNITLFQYDANGNQTQMIQAYRSSVAATSNYHYDGNVTLQSNPNGTSLSMSYDADGQLTSELWYAGGSVSNSLSYSYDKDGNILTASNDAGTESFAYNADGEKTQAVSPNGVTLNYQYDAVGHVTQTTDSLGDTVTSQYDANGNLSQRDATGPGGAPADVTLGYDGDGNLTSVTRQGKVSGTLQTVGSSSYAYDAQGNVSNIVHKNASASTLDSFSYSYNGASQLTQEVDYNGSTTNYSYDATGQLTAAGPTNYRYDVNGNPTDAGNTIGPNNELLSDPNYNYSYDLDGNLIGKTFRNAGQPTWVYGYDGNNELISATETNSQGQPLVSATYSYDVFGDRIESSVSTNGGSPVVTHFVYDGATLWATQNGSGSLQTLYVSGDQPDQFFAQIDASTGVSWYLTDHLGSVRDEMNNSGQVTNSFTYNAYGNEGNLSNSPLIGYAGYQIDVALGLNYAHYRWYNPYTGQWVTEDPELLDAGPNLREYVSDDPTNATDPTGMYLKLTKDQVAPVEKYLGQKNISQEDVGGGYYRIKITNSAQAGVNLSRYVQRTNSSISAREKALDFGSSVLEAAEAEKDFTWEEVVNQYRSQKRAEAAASAPAPAQERHSTGPSGTRRSVYVPGRGMRTVDERNQLVTPYNLPVPSDDGGILPKFLATNEFQQSLRLAGGGAAVVSGVILLATLGGQVFGVILIGSGLDDVQASVRSLQKGKHIDSIRHDVAVKVAVAAGLDEKKGGQVVGFIADVGIPVAAELQIGRISTLGKLSKIEKGGEEVTALGKLGRAANAEVKVCTVTNSCFAVGTPLLTPDGFKLVEQFQPGDWVLSRSEFDPDGPLTAKVVEAVFKRVGRILHLHIGGQLIRTTTEHPFWVYNRGWLMASQLRVGDLLVSHEGQLMPIEDLLDTGEYETVYNLRIADYHT